ncbi:GCN5-related protein N-acetyltransferase [Beutenbergia cavernae DSM 12333]|uniref:GCN5-related protein N-acetyltransferase n=1 Tax=Beutenbergia cavernae (strain ATCC BAA-8 / DSM 12333 / CCUG 43141 / JCM 11478 / NBRC 16432 / NCIMB 13614 / HKI 0122) TaxID=471853 RepID=C5C5J4_BEUC1|nr:GNAT family N-acetyltransferase [Beutenbergia cavernae]ACQ80185.1 GCN5-related protein N-acetyltransferase [Beutenbergia cavernae DSM 12333]
MSAPGDPAAAGYPQHWEADVLLRDGSTMHIRPIRPSDADALQRFHTAQSEESVYFRFFAPMRRLGDRDLTRFTNVDHVDRVALVLTIGDDIVAVGRYDRLDQARAEVAFNVADAYQGRGLGSILLEHLAAAARERGIRRFVADVLPGNAKMINVFTEAGYDVTQRFDDGVISVEFRIDPTERSLAVMAQREQRTEALSMSALLAASSVLVVGGGTPEDVLAVRALEAVLASEFTGAVTCVGEVLRGPAEGTRARWHASIDGAIGDGRGADLAVVALPPAAVVDLLGRLTPLGTHGVVVLSDGFGTGDPTRPADVTQADLVAAARTRGVRVVGPRSYGILAQGEAGRMNATLWPRAARVGDVGLFCQSGAAAAALAASVEGRRLGLSTFLSAGHRADVSGNDAMQFWQSDERTKVAALYLESFGNPRKFSRVARRLSAQTPVVALVSGQRGQVVAPGHLVATTGAPRRTTEEMLRQAGVLAAQTTHELLDMATVLSAQPLPAGERVAVLTNSGTLAALVVDALGARGLEVAGEPVALAPLADGAGYEAAVRTLLDGADRGEWDSAVVAYVPPLGERDPAVGEALARLAHESARPVVGVVLGLRGLTPELTTQGVTVPAYGTAEDAVHALAAAHTYARWRRTDHGTLVVPDGIDRHRAKELVGAELARVAPAERRRLDAPRATELLGAYGIRLWPAIGVASAQEAVTAADELGWPVALKSTDERLRHRADLGGVRLDISTPAELAEAVAQMRRRLATGAAPAPHVEVQAMAPLGVACVVRGEEDPLYGPVVAFGLGGDAVELLGDVSYGVPPLTTSDVTRMVRSVRAAPRLFGHRGLPPVRVAALEDVVARVSVLKDDLPEVVRVELNPVLAATSGAAVLSAVVEVAHPERGDDARRVMRSTRLARPRT